MNTYRALSPPAEAMFGPGVFERDFSASEEADLIGAGLVALVPRSYVVLSDNYVIPGDEGAVFITHQGDRFEAAIPVDVEAALVAGGHIERTTDPQPTPKRK